jgi:ATP-binding cassette subfamily F protein 3
VRRKKILKRQPTKGKQQNLYEDQKGKALQNKLSKIESQIKQLERDIQQDDKMLTLIMTNILKMLSFTYYNKKNQSRSLLLDWEIIQEEIDNLYVT